MRVVMSCRQSCRKLHMYNHVHVISCHITYIYIYNHRQTIQYRDILERERKPQQLQLARTQQLPRAIGSLPQWTRNGFLKVFDAMVKISTAVEPERSCTNAFCWTAEIWGSHFCFATTRNRVRVPGCSMCSVLHFIQQFHEMKHEASRLGVAHDGSFWESFWIFKVYHWRFATRWLCLLSEAPISSQPQRKSGLSLPKTSRMTGKKRERAFEKFGKLHSVVRLQQDNLHTRTVVKSDPWTEAISVSTAILGECHVIVMMSSPLEPTSMLGTC